MLQFLTLLTIQTSLLTLLHVKSVLCNVYLFPAFTWFSVCEYILATANMAFHAVVVRDLPYHQLQVIYPNNKKTM